MVIIRVYSALLPSYESWPNVSRFEGAGKAKHKHKLLSLRGHPTFQHICINEPNIADFDQFVYLGSVFHTKLDLTRRINSVRSTTILDALSNI